MGTSEDLRIKDLKSRLDRILLIEHSLKNLLVDISLIKMNFKIDLIIDFQVIFEYLFPKPLKKVGSRVNFEVYQIPWLFSLINAFKELSDGNSPYNLVLILPYKYELERFSIYFSHRTIEENLSDRKKGLNEIIDKIRKEYEKGDIDNVISFIKNEYLNLYFSYFMYRYSHLIKRKVELINKTVIDENTIWEEFLKGIFKYGKIIFTDPIYRKAYKKLSRIRKHKNLQNIIDSIAISYVANLNKWLTNDHNRKAMNRIALLMSQATSMIDVLLNDEHLKSYLSKYNNLMYLFEYLNKSKRNFTSFDNFGVEFDLQSIFDDYDIHCMYREPSFFLTFLIIDYPDDFFGYLRKVNTKSFSSGFNIWTSVYKAAIHTLLKISYEIRSTREMLDKVLDMINFEKSKKYVDNYISSIDKKISNVENYIYQLFSINLARFPETFKRLLLIETDKTRMIDDLLYLLQNEKYQSIFAKQTGDLFFMLKNAFHELDKSLVSFDNPEVDFWTLLHLQFRRLRGVPWEIKFRNKLIADKIKNLSQLLDDIDKHKPNISKLNKEINSLINDLKDLSTNYRGMDSNFFVSILQTNEESIIKKSDLNDNLEYLLLNNLLKYLYGKYDDVVYSLGYIVKNYPIIDIKCSCVTELLLLYTITYLKKISKFRCENPVEYMDSIDDILTDLENILEKLNVNDNRIKNLKGVICLKRWERPESTLIQLEKCRRIFNELIESYNKLSFKRDFFYLAVVNNYVYTFIIEAEQYESNGENNLSNFSFPDSLSQHIKTIEINDELIEREHYFEFFHTLSLYYYYIYKITKSKDDLKNSRLYLNKCLKILKNNINILERWNMRRVDHQIYKCYEKKIIELQNKISN